MINLLRNGIITPKFKRIKVRGYPIELNNSIAGKLKNYIIYGTENGVGDKTKNLCPVNYGYYKKDDIREISGENVIFYLDPDTEYVLTYDLNVLRGSGKCYFRFRLDYYDENDNIISYGDTTALKASGNVVYKFITPLNCKYVITKLQFSPQTTEKLEFEFLNIQVEEGQNATFYEPYGYKVPIIVQGENDVFKRNLYLDKPLYERECINYLIEKSCVVYVFDGKNILSVDTKNKPDYVEVIYSKKMK